MFRLTLIEIDQLQAGEYEHWLKHESGIRPSDMDMAQRYADDHGLSLTEPPRAA